MRCRTLSIDSRPFHRCAYARHETDCCDLIQIKRGRRTDGTNRRRTSVETKKELVDLSRMLDIRFTLMWRQRMPLLPAHATEIRETGRGMGLLQARHLHLSTNEKQARMHREFGRTNERRPKGRDERRSQVSQDVRSGAYRCVSFVDGNARPP